MLKLVGVSLLSAFSILANAQFVLSGTVFDSETKERLVGASVQLLEYNQNEITNDKGEFEFANVKQGSVTIRVRFVGFEEQNLIMILNSDQTTDIILTASSLLKEEIIVKGTRAAENAPFTFTHVDKPTLQKQNFGQDMPFLLNWTPSVVTTSDAGTGIGYTGIRIRGSDATRINVTINGIPYNDSESQSVYWVDVPDIATSTQNIQIQRGVGTSSNGAGAFGASINLQTNSFQDKPYADVINSFGSFRTLKNTIGAGTGRMENNFSFDMRASVINSDGFIDRASSDLKSYYFSAGYFGKKTLVKLIAFGGKEITYQSWYGVPQSRLSGNADAMQETAVTEGWTQTETDNLLNSNSRTFNHYTYKNQVDNYGQYHYQLHVSHRFSPELTGNISLHSTLGKGFYEEFKTNAAFADYGVTDAVIGTSTVSNSDLVRRRWLDNKFYGFTYSLQLDKNRWNSVLGGGWNQYQGDHFGRIIWAEVSSTIPNDHQYYFNHGLKTDFNVYWKNSFQLLPKFIAFADVQLRTIGYKTSGIENNLNAFTVSKQFAFFNPKAGLTFQATNNIQLYTSVAVAHREPVRDDFVDAPAGSNPKPESLNDFEIGMRVKQKKFAFTVNGYFMDYKNQLVLTGALNDVGASIRTNVAKSYRTGIELETRYQITPKLNWLANLTLSKNKVKNFNEVLYDYGDNFDTLIVIENKYTKSDISFSPNIIAGSNLSYTILKGLEITWLNKFVGKQFLDNTSNHARKIDSYFIQDARLSYSITPKGMRSISLSLLLNNFLNKKYQSNGYTYGFMGGATTYRQNYYYPQAGRNFMLMLALRF